MLEQLAGAGSHLHAFFLTGYYPPMVSTLTLRPYSAMGKFCTTDATAFSNREFSYFTKTCNAPR